MFYCEICNYTSKDKSNYNKHLNTKKHQKKNDSLKIAKEVENQKLPDKRKNEPKRAKMSQNEPAHFGCKFCGKDFSTKAILRRHEMHRCKENKKSLSDLLEKKNFLIKEEKNDKKKLYKHIEKLLEKVGDTITNNTFNQTNNIVLKNYGQEDLSHITNHVLDNLISSPCHMINKLTKMIHFNEEKPENMNIFIPNKKDKYIKVFKNNTWTLEEKKECIPDIVDRNYNILDTHYENNKEKLNTFVKTNFLSIQGLIDNKEEKTIQDQCDKVELEILNGSQKIKKI